MSSYAIIGFGCAGYQAARAIRGRDERGAIDVFSGVGLGPSKPMLSTQYTKGNEYLIIYESESEGTIDILA